MKYKESEESFVAYVDFLGFSEASRELNESQRQEVLALLAGLVGRRSEFKANIEETTEIGSVYRITPELSTFSDHIVISYDLETLRQSTTLSEDTIAIVILSKIKQLASSVAADALRLGFLIRGAATIGRLYHDQGVVFGEALVEAVSLESRTAFYPRIILSASVASRADWTPYSVKDDDGIYCIDYTSRMLFSFPPGEVREWLDAIIVVVKSQLERFAASGSLNELAKWSWFAKRFRAEMQKIPADALSEMNVSLASIPWGQ